MNTLSLTPLFKRNYKRFVRRHSELVGKIDETLRQLQSDHTHPGLRTHALDGKLAGCYACTVAYDLRIVFQIEDAPQPFLKKIVLLNIGTHDQVY